MSRSTTSSGKPRVVIIGGGFGGLNAAQKLAGRNVDVTVIDRCNHHLFQPLLYQVATADLSPADIAWPIRSILSPHRNIRVVLDEVKGVDLEHQTVQGELGRYHFDYLVVATGMSTTYFGNEHWEADAPGLKTLADATELRARILLAFERAEMSEDPEERRRLLNFVVVGGGPTGVEMAGAIAELAKAALAKDFRRIDPGDARIILVEGSERILGAFPVELSEYTARALDGLGVELLVNKLVVACDARMVDLGDQTIPTGTIIWAAGVAAHGAGRWLGVPTDRAGRVAVEPDLSVPGHPEVFVIGDAAKARWKNDSYIPGIAPAAKQQGKYVGKRIMALMHGKNAPAFRYRHAGNLATIGRHRAVVDFGRRRLKGWLAWWFWGLIHIYFLIGVRSATVVMLQWFWVYLTRKKGARLISGSPPAAVNQEPGRDA